MFSAKKVFSGSFKAARPFIILLWFTSCAMSSHIGSGVTDAGQEIYLEPSSPSQTEVQDFQKSHSLASADEKSKISFILERVQESPYTFIRNGQEANGRDTANFIRWKMRRPRWKDIDTADDFINVLMKGSVMSGRPYEIVLPDGTRHNLQPVLTHELEALESILTSTAS